MSYRLSHPKSIARATEDRAKRRAWHPRIAELFTLWSSPKCQQPTTTKRGPGRRHRQGYSRIQERLNELRLREIEQQARQALAGQGAPA